MLKIFTPFGTLWRFEMDVLAISLQAAANCFIGSISWSLCSFKSMWSQTHSAFDQVFTTTYSYLWYCKYLGLSCVFSSICSKLYLSSCLQRLCPSKHELNHSVESGNKTHSFRWGMTIFEIKNCITKSRLEKWALTSTVCSKTTLLMSMLEQASSSRCTAQWQQTAILQSAQ